MPRGARWWLIPVAVLVVMEAITFGLGSADYPTLSTLTDPWLERYAVRATAFLGWLAAFWALVKR